MSGLWLWMPSFPKTEQSPALGIAHIYSRSIPLEEATLEYEEGLLRVLENHADSYSNVIELPFKIIRTDSDRLLPPIFLLEGGPANNPSIQQQWKDVAPLLKAFSRRSDIVVLEQRGNANAVPNLQCSGLIELPMLEPLSKEDFGKAFQNYVLACQESLIKQGIVTSNYHVLAMSQDLEALRNALGYKQVFLFGGSFGSHWALNYLKRYPENVARVVIDSPEGFDHTMKLPMYAEGALLKLSRKIGKLPGWESGFHELVAHILEQLEIPKTEVVNGTKIVLGKYDLQLITALALGRTEYRELPGRFLEMLGGNFQWLAQQSMQLRNGTGYNFLSIISDCTSGASKKRLETIKETRSQTLLGDALNNINFEACDLLETKMILEQIQEPIQSEVPILIAVGDQDVRTPPANASSILEMFTNGYLITVKNASHDLFEEAGDILFPHLIDFLSRDNLAGFPKTQTLQIPLEMGL